MMKLYMLVKDHKVRDYDSSVSLIVAASSATVARSTAAREDAKRNNIGSNAWLDPKLSTCKEVKMPKRAAIIHTETLDG